MLSVRSTSILLLKVGTHFTNWSLFPRPPPLAGLPLWFPLWLNPWVGKIPWRRERLPTPLSAFHFYLRQLLLHSLFLWIWPFLPFLPPSFLSFTFHKKVITVFAFLSLAYFIWYKALLVQTCPIVHTVPVCGLSPQHQAVLRHQLGVLVFNSLLMISTWG